MNVLLLLLITLIHLYIFIFIEGIHSYKYSKLYRKIV